MPDVTLDATEQDDVLASEIFHLGIASVDPSVGTDLGGMLVTITGVGFTAGVPTVDFDGIPATDVIVNSDTELTCVSPAGFMVAPTSGVENGGTQLTIRGRGFTAGSTVLIGGIPALNISIVDSRTILCTTPPGPPEGPTSVSVNGVTRNKAFKYGLDFLELRFWESRFGSDIGDISVYVVDATGNILETIYEVSGTSGTSAWEEIVTQFVKPGGPYRIAWRHQLGSSFRVDYAIDNVTIDGENYSFDSGHDSFRTTSGLDTTDPVAALSNSILVPTLTSGVLGRWNRNSGGTGSSSTGPTGAQNGTHYVYTEYRTANTNSWLFSPEMTP